MYIVMRWRAALLSLIFGVIMICVIAVMSAVPVSDHEIALKYLEKQGWSVIEATLTEEEVIIPLNWDEVMYSYNDIQKESGFDLGRYCGEKVVRVRIAVAGMGDNVFANVFIYKGKVVGGDVSSSALDGFIMPLTKNKK